MQNITNDTTKLNSHNSYDGAEIDPIGEALFAAFCVKSKVAQQSNSLAEGIAAGRSWARFIGHYEKSPGVSAGISE